MGNIAVPKPGGLIRNEFQFVISNFTLRYLHQQIILGAHNKYPYSDIQYLQAMNI